MNHFFSSLKRAALAGALALQLLPAAGHAATTSYFVPFEGAGNISIFDASTGSGGWVGSIDPTPDPLANPPFPGVSTVLFRFDAATRMLMGSFEISSGDLSSTLVGTLTGSTTDADFLGAGGQLSIDYTITGGTGLFDSARGFGLAFVNYDPTGAFNNYSETGLLNFAVPTPSTLALLLPALALLALRRQRQAQHP
jgi:hypothetical protein